MKGPVLETPMKCGNMRIFKKATTLFDSIIGVMGFLTGVVLVYVMLSVCLGVFMRYFLGRPLIWVLQLGEYSMLFIPLLGGAWLLRTEGHVAIDLVTDRLRPGLQTGVRIVTSIMGAVLCFGLFWYGVGATWDAYQRGLYPSWSVMPIPDVYVRFIIPLGFFLLAIQFMRIAVRLWRGQRNVSHKEPGEEKMEQI